MARIIDGQQSQLVKYCTQTLGWPLDCTGEYQQRNTFVVLFLYYNAAATFLVGFLALLVYDILYPTSHISLYIEIVLSKVDLWPPHATIVFIVHDMSRLFWQ